MRVYDPLSPNDHNSGLRVGDKITFDPRTAEITLSRNSGHQLCWRRADKYMPAIVISGVSTLNDFEAVIEVLSASMDKPFEKVPEKGEKVSYQILMHH